MDVKGTTNKIVACSGNTPCTASIGTGSTCSAASSPLVGVRCLAPCPTIYKVGDTQVQGTDGWNSWTASCAMVSTYLLTSGTVKIKKDPSMPGELVIDRGATSGDNRHFIVNGALEMEGVTLTGGYTIVSSCCSLYSL